MKKVAVIMGSDSDFPVVKNALTELKSFGVPFEAHVMSAHRSPVLAAEFADKAEENGFGVIICAAGMAAHLAGVIASHTILPVIGIPVKTDMMGGLDSLLSTVQMPGDVPVATVGTGSGGARNAGILAVQILAGSDPELARQLVSFKHKLVEKIAAKDAAFQEKLANS